MAFYSGGGLATLATTLGLVALALVFWLHLESLFLGLVRAGFGLLVIISLHLVWFDLGS